MHPSLVLRLPPHLQINPLAVTSDKKQVAISASDTPDKEDAIELSVTTEAAQSLSRAALAALGHGFALNLSIHSEAAIASVSDALPEDTSGPIVDHSSSRPVTSGSGADVSRDTAAAAAGALEWGSFAGGYATPMGAELARKLSNI